jgi:hypothetical protein
MAVIGILLVLLTPFGLCPDESPSPASTQDVIVSLIQSLDNANLDDGRCTEEICRLPRIAPTSIEAQQAIIRYLERIAAASGSRGVPVFWARSLSLYDTSFAAKLMTLLSESQNESVTELCLTTTVLMGEKARAQIPSLEKYLHNQSDSGSRIRTQIVLAILRHSLDEATAHTIERSIHDRDRVGLEAVTMAMRVGFRGWATDGIISEVKHCLRADAIDDRNDDFPCAAAMSLAVSGHCDTQCEGVVKTLLTAAMDDPDSPAPRMYYAYALAITNRTSAESMWRVVLKTYVREGDLPVGSAASIILATIPRDHVEILGRLCEDPDPDVASGAKEFMQCLELWLGLEKTTKADGTPTPAVLGEAATSPAEKQSP